MLLRFPTVPAGNSWWHAYKRRIVTLAGLDDITTCYRLNVRADGRIERVLSAVFEPRNEQVARRFFGGMSMLEAYERDTVDFPDDGGKFETWAADFPPLRCSLVGKQLQSGRCWLACDFRAGTHLDTLVNEAQVFGFAFGYQAQFRPFMPTPAQRQRIGYNLIALRSVNGVPSDLLADQERQAQDFASATLLVEEIVAVEDNDAAAWLNSCLARLYKASPVGARLDSPGFECRAESVDCSLMMHSTLLYRDWTDDDLICSQSEQEAFRLGIIGYRPSAEAVSRAGPSPGRDREPPPDPWPPDLKLPAPYNGSGHIFISYKRTDLPRIVGIMERLATEGLPIWYDRGNYGGDEWDVELERKIHEASMILFFMTQSSADSRYCKREVRLADTVEKPILVVVLERIELPYGLKFLSLVQAIHANDREFDVLLDKAIRRQLAAAGISPP
ncbi:MAG TPA: toll/interleukin-1 receptor domain-containing protein [Xanthobacteraceae bacterium]|nr:toll/interleukin-1 receptor domain-containing protein [Xanthobacteraceae bacterium]